MGYQDGRRVRKFVIAATRGEAAAKLGPLLKARDEQRPVPSQRDKLGPFLRRWLDEVARPTLRASTYRSYDDILRCHLIPGLGRTALAKLTPADVQTFLNSKLATGLSPRRVAPTSTQCCAGPWSPPSDGDSSRGTSPSWSTPRGCRTMRSDR